MFANDLLRPKATWSSPKPTYFSNGEEHPPVYTPDESHLEYSRRNFLLLLSYRTQAASLFPLRPTVRRRLSLRRNAGIGEPPQAHAAVGSAARSAVRRNAHPVVFAWMATVAVGDLGTARRSRLRRVLACKFLHRVNPSMWLVLLIPIPPCTASGVIMLIT
jgi:hypothetical protein